MIDTFWLGEVFPSGRGAHRRVYDRNRETKSDIMECEARELYILNDYEDEAARWQFRVVYPRKVCCDGDLTARSY